MQIELSPGEGETLWKVLDDYVSDLRMEIANTDSFDAREELKEREAFLKRVVEQLRGQILPSDVTAGRKRPSP